MRMISSTVTDGLSGSSACGGLHGEGKLNTGYDVLANDYVMPEAGIIDLAKEDAQRVENACSIAAMILTTSALVTDIPGSRRKPLLAPTWAAWAWACSRLPHPVFTVQLQAHLRRPVLLSGLERPTERGLMHAPA